MTLKEAKDKIAINHYYVSWQDFLMIEGDNEGKMEDMLSEAAELYARSKWESGLNAAIKKFEEAKEKAETLRDVVYLDGVLTILDLTKPEFKP